MVRRCPSGGAPAPAGEPSCGSGRPRILLSPMTLLADLEEFVRDDRPHGPRPLTPRRRVEWLSAHRRLLRSGVCLDHP